MFRHPLRSTLHILMMLALSGIADSIGDRGIFWLAVFSVFIVPSFIVKRNDALDDTDLIELSGLGETVTSFFIEVWTRIDARIPKFSDLSDLDKSAD